MEGRVGDRSADEPAPEGRTSSVEVHIGTIGAGATVQVGDGNSAGEGPERRPGRGAAASDATLAAWLSLLATGLLMIPTALAVGGEKLPPLLFWLSAIGAAVLGPVGLGCAISSVLGRVPPRWLARGISVVAAAVLLILTVAGVLAVKPPVAMPPPTPAPAIAPPVATPSATSAPTPTPSPPPTASRMPLNSEKPLDVQCGGPVDPEPQRLGGITYEDSISFPAGPAKCGDGARFAVPADFQTLDVTLGTTAHVGSMQLQILDGETILFSLTLAAGATPVHISCDVRGMGSVWLHVNYPTPGPDPGAYAVFGRAELSTAPPPQAGPCRPV